MSDFARPDPADEMPRGDDLAEIEPTDPDATDPDSTDPGALVDAELSEPDHVIEVDDSET